MQRNKRTKWAGQDGSEHQVGGAGWEWAGHDTGGGRGRMGVSTKWAGQDGSDWDMTREVGVTGQKMDVTRQEVSGCVRIGSGRENTCVG